MGPSVARLRRQSGNTPGGATFPFLNTEFMGTYAAVAREGRSGVQSDRLVVRVLLVDEQEVVRRGVAKVLQGDTALRVVGEAGSVSQALRRAPAVGPDVAVVATQFPDGSGAHLCKRLQALVPGLRCLVLSDAVTDETMNAAMRAGAAGYLGKHVLGPALLAAVRRVASGETVFDSEAAARQLVNAPTARRDRVASLTDHERMLLRLIGQGLTNQGIADQTGLATKTVKNYVSRLLAKLRLGNRTQAAILATQLRVDPLGDEPAA